MRSRSKHINGLLFALSLSLVLFAPAAMSYVDPAFDQGLIKMKAADYDGAAECFGESLGLNPNDPRSLVLRGECFYKMGNYAFAIQDCTTAIQYAPNNIRAYLIRGICHSNLGKDGMAILDFQNAIKLDPKLAEAFFNHTTGGGVPALKKLEKLTDGAVPDNNGNPMASDNAIDADQDNSSGLNVHAIKDYQEAMSSLYPNGYSKPTATAPVNINDGNNAAQGAAQTANQGTGKADGPSGEYKFGGNGGNAGTHAGDFTGQGKIKKNLTPAQADQEANGDNAVGLKKEASTTKTRLPYIFKDSQNNADLESSDIIAKSRNERFTPNLDQDPDRGQFGLVPGSGEFQGDAKQAIYDFSQGLKMDVSNAEYFYKRAKAWQKLGKVNEAMGDFNHAILQDPQQAKYYIGRASLYYQLGRAVLMDADIVAARNCNPDLPAVIHFNLTKLPANTQWAGDGPD